jgi:hypothetical protein
MQISLIAANGSSESLSANMNISVYTDVLIPSDPDRALQANTSIAVRLNVSNNSGGTTGPWCLGVPYVYNIRNVYKSSNTGTFGGTVTIGNNIIVTDSTSFSNGVVVSGYGIPSGSYATVINSSALSLSSVATINSVGQFTYAYYSNAASDDVTNMFSLDDGQTDAYFDQAFLIKNPNYSSFGIGPNDLITVIFDAYLPQNTGKGYISVDSYVTLINSNSITWDQIPTYTDTNGVDHDLRNSIDFRPFVSNTAAYQTVFSNSVINPVYTSSFPASENYIVSPNQSFVYDIDYYIGRYDKLMMNSYGAYSVVEGTPSELPTVPADKTDTVTLATLYVPPYPSLANDVNITMSTQNKVYRMQDIAAIDNRVANLEYYTSLSLLEQATSSLTIINSTTGTNRFKNGIFVDNFTTTDTMDLSNPEFKAYLSSSENAVVPRVALTSVGLQFASGNNTILQGNLVTLPATTEVLISNKFATDIRNVTESYYNYVGQVRLDPNYDELCDINTGDQINTGYTIGQLYVDITDNSSGNVVFTGYSGNGNAPGGLVQLGNMPILQAATYLASYFNVDLTTPVNANRYGGITAKPFTMNQTGYFIAPETGNYIFDIYHDDGFVLQVGQRTWSMSTATLVTYQTDPIPLVAGQYYFFKLTLTANNAGTTYIQFGFHVNSSSYQGQASNGTKPVAASMFARSNDPSAYPVVNPINSTYYGNISDISEFPGINIDNAFLSLSLGTDVVSHPFLTEVDQIIPILSDKA